MAFIVSLEIRWCTLSNLFFIFSIFDYSGSFAFPYTISNQLIVPTKMPARISVVMALNLEVNLERIDNLIMSSFSIMSMEKSV